MIILSKEIITQITVGGFKSISEERTLEIKPLTIIAGANSSGKSSFMQALLLLKQTLEANYDPGAILLNGPNVKFTSADQLLSRTSDGKSVDSFHVGVKIATGTSVTTSLKQGKNKGFDVQETTYSTGVTNFRLFPGIPQDKIQSIYDRAHKGFSSLGRADSLIFAIRPNRCFLNLYAGLKDEVISEEDICEQIRLIRNEIYLDNSIHQIIHLPGLRGRPERDYLSTAVGSTFPGTFEIYTASIIEQWQLDNDTDRLEKLFNHLARLALSRKVVARRKNDTAIELLVNRFLQGDKEDMVSIADVGLGVSQALPVVVALQAAKSGQLVYIEQPEIHLHPRAQYAMAEVLADAAKEEKWLVIETHSSLLLLGIQTLVAEGKLPPELVKLHWFTQQEDGSTKIDSTDLDETGAYGDWPEDFASVTLHSESRYLDAAEARLMGD